MGGYVDGLKEIAQQNSGLTAGIVSALGFVTHYFCGTADSRENKATEELKQAKAEIVTVQAQSVVDEASLDERFDSSHFQEELTITGDIEVHE